ncbi:MAG: FHA domain-containing protein [Bdellovibrionales bacterium]|nr:FHA domain-containing protein [Bdellovibrionales bacterium]
MKAFLIHAQTKKKFRVKTDTTIGRMDCDRSYPDDGRMSRTHCVLRCTDEVFTVEDLESKNGVLVNGELIPARTPVRLRTGGKLIIGDQEFEVLITGQTVEMPAGMPSQIVKTTDDFSNNNGLENQATSSNSRGVQPDDLSRTEVSSEKMEKTVPDGNTNLFQFGRESSNSGIAKNWSEEGESKSSSMVTAPSFASIADLGVPDDTGKSQNLSPPSPPPNLLKAINASPDSDTPVAPSFDHAAENAIIIDPNLLKLAEPQTEQYTKDKNRGKKRSKNSEEAAHSQPGNKSFEEKGRKDSSFSIYSSHFSIWRSTLLGLIIGLPVPLIFLLDQENIYLLTQIRDPRIIIRWLGVLILPILLSTGFIQKIRIHTGWRTGAKSISLSLMALSMIALFHLTGIHAIERTSDFDEKRFTLKVKKACIDKYKPEKCSEVVFTCPQCLRDLGFTERQALLESIYPFVEDLTKRENELTRLPSHQPTHQPTHQNGSIKTQSMQSNKQMIPVRPLLQGETQNNSPTKLKRPVVKNLSEEDNPSQRQAHKSNPIPTSIPKPSSGINNHIQDQDLVPAPAPTPDKKNPAPNKTSSDSENVQIPNDASE